MTLPISVDEAWLKSAKKTEVLQEVQRLAKNKKKYELRLDAVKTVEYEFNVITPQYEPIFLEYLGICIGLVGDFKTEVSEPARIIARKIFHHFNKYSTKGYMTMAVLLERGLDASTKPISKELTFEFIDYLAENSPNEIRANMDKIVPKIAELLVDMNTTVVQMAKVCMEKLCECIQNADIDPFIPKLVEVFMDNTQATEIIHSLAGVTFVQEVDCATLSIIVPVLLIGFKSRVDSTIRLTSVIVANMVKLVNDPIEVSEYMGLLLPPLERASQTVSTPEAREMCGKAFEQVRALNDKIAAIELPPAVAIDCDEGVRAYAEGIVNMLIQTNDFEEDVWMGVLDGVLPKGKVDEVWETYKGRKRVQQTAEVEDDDTAEQLCDCSFTLAYGNKILLHNTELRLKRGYRYGLIGPNNCGKSTLLRAIANEQVEGFPPSTELKTVFVESDILGELSHLNPIDYIFADERIKAAGVSKDEIRKILLDTDFTENMVDNAVSTLSGGWRIKLALSRAMLQRADILMLDEPTNHLDVVNVAWVENYLCSLKDVTSIIVSHNRSTLDKCCTHILHFENYKLRIYKGNLSDFTKINPHAASYFAMKSTTGMKFKFPEPGFVDGVKQAGTSLMKMEGVDFKYPTGEKNVLNGITVRVSMASKIACIGRNGQGKSTLIKLLTGELEPCTGSVWKKTGLRFGYLAQHSFHHIEHHLTKTPNEYINWRFSHGVDKEILEKDTYVITDAEREVMKSAKTIEVTDERGQIKKIKQVVDKLTGQRKTVGKDQFTYELKWEHGGCQFYSSAKLLEWGFEKVMKQIDLQVEAETGMFNRTLSQKTVEDHLALFGLGAEFATHTRIGALSASQKLRVVLAAAVWQAPSILILDEPTNYFDRESMIALAEGLRDFKGGFIVISHNDDFVQDICKEFWTLEEGRLNVKGDQEWMANQLKTQVEFKVVEEVVDSHGNVSKVKVQTTLTGKDKKNFIKKVETKIKNGIAIEDDERDMYEELTGKFLDC